ncbi:MAG: hypothetical protein WCT10_05120 [Patescibacteria group bacterium]
MIDCNSRPFIPRGWSVWDEEQLPNVVRGQIEFDPSKVAFHLDDAQKKDAIVGNDLKKKLTTGIMVYGAQVLDYLLANTNLIPESWKTDEQGRTRYIYFWGTIYRDSRGRPCVRCLDLYVGRWGWDCCWLCGDFGGQRPAAVFAS